MPDHSDQKDDVPFFVSRDKPEQEEEQEVFSSVGPTPPPTTNYQSASPSAPPPVPPAAPPRPRTTGGYRAVPQAPAQHSPRLEVRDHKGHALAPIPLDKDRLTIGQSSHCDATFSHPPLSPWHAALIKTSDGKFLLQDLQSLNGVFLGIADDFQLEDGDLIALGQQRFVFHLTTSPPRFVTPPPHEDTPLMGAPSQGHYPHLIRLLSGGFVGGLYPLHRPLTIGRGAVEVSCPEDFSLEEQHAHIERKGPHFVLRDLGSRSGSYIRVYAPVELFSGDRFLLGSLEFCLRMPSAA